MPLIATLDILNLSVDISSWSSLNLNLSLMLIISYSVPARVKSVTNPIEIMKTHFFYTKFIHIDAELQFFSFLFYIVIMKVNPTEVIEFPVHKKKKHILSKIKTKLNQCQHYQPK